MNESAFKEKNIETWNDLKAIIEKSRLKGINGLDSEEIRKLGVLYKNASSALSYARTQGASEELIIYLNDLSGSAHGLLYSGYSAKSESLKEFILFGFPALIRESYKYILVAAIIFWVCFIIGILASQAVYDFIKPIMPHALAKGDSFKDLKSPLTSDPVGMSTYIMLNNVKEALYAFIGGITAGVFSVFSLAKNGFVIGIVAAVILSISKPLPFLSLLLPHGFIELTALFISGGAGLMMGASLISPGNLKRGDALKVSSKKALRLFAGSVVMLIVAAIIEGFVTPSILPVFIKLMFAGVTLVVLILYIIKK
jgi:uncharacterized membrane protein SpoIIM required for sporulation